MANPSPTYTFTVNTQILNRFTAAHPDSYSQQSNFQSTIDNRKNYISTWIPGLLRGSNIAHKNGDTVVAYGLQGKYLNDNFTSGDSAFLTLVSIT